MVSDISRDWPDVDENEGWIGIKGDFWSAGMTSWAVSRDEMPEMESSGMVLILTKLAGIQITRFRDDGEAFW